MYLKAGADPRPDGTPWAQQGANPPPQKKKTEKRRKNEVTHYITIVMNVYKGKKYLIFGKYWLCLKEGLQIPSIYSFGRPK